MVSLHHPKRAKSVARHAGTLGTTIRGGRRMRILSIPLDERPFTYDYAAQIAASAEGIEYVQPPISMMGAKKKPADIERLWEFVFSELPSCDAAILSAETLVYGGLIPSRTHHHSIEELLSAAQRFQRLRTLNPTARILVFSLIMRIPAYDGDEEEPDYHERWGRKLFEYSQSLALRHQNPADSAVAKNLSLLEAEIPEEIRKEFLGRRQTNHEVTKYLLGLYADRTFDDFVIPQDDNSPLGLQVLEREALLQQIRNGGLQVEIYPGADEVGCSLLSRTVRGLAPKRARVGVIWSTVSGPDIIPLYEGQPYRETVRQHVESAGMEMVSSEGYSNGYFNGVDIVLAVNTPSVAMRESSEQRLWEPTEALAAFADTVERIIETGTPVLVADVAYANGSDLTLVQMLKQRGLLGKLSGYSAINTNGNSLGTVLALGCATLAGADTSELVLQRLIDDCCYQSVVRKLTGALYPSAWHGEDDGAKRMIEYLMPLAIDYFIGTIPYSVSCQLPWDRLFECKVKLTLKCDTAVGAWRNPAIFRPQPQFSRQATPEAPHTQLELAADLSGFGIPRNSTVLIHSSCKSVGPVEGGADTILDIFQDYFKQGLLVFPTHTWDKVNPENPVFNVADTSCCTGILPELFRKRQGVVRSGHPTHSVAARGMDAQTFTADDVRFDTPCARGSSWGKLLDRDAVIMLLGVTFIRNTFIHGIEEYLDIPGRLTDTHTMYYSVQPDGTKIEVPSRRHTGHPSDMFDRILPDCLGKGIVRRGFFGDAPVLWFRARELASEVAWRLFMEPHLFDNPEAQD